MRTARVENSADPTRGEPLARRASQRKVELERALEKLPAHDLCARNDIAIALKVADEMITGEVEHLAGTTAATMSLWLERCEHVAEMTPIRSSPSPPADEDAIALGRRRLGACSEPSTEGHLP
jgi:hypothetical protein